MPIISEPISKRPSTEDVQPRFKLGDYVTAEYYDIPQSRTPSKATGAVRAIGRVGNNFFYSVQPEGFSNKVISDIPEEDISKAQQPIKRK